MDKNVERRIETSGSNIESIKERTKKNFPEDHKLTLPKVS